MSDFAEELGRERAADLFYSLAHIEPAHSLMKIEGRITASYDDGMCVTLQIEMEPHHKADDHKKRIRSAVGKVAISCLLFALIVACYVGVSMLREGNGDGRSSAAIFLIGAAGFLAGMNWSKR